MAGQISNGAIDEMYAAARRAGARGGKITGAGGGGFLLLYAPYEKHGAIREAMAGLQELPFRLETDGSKVIFNYRR
jgi:D-glycero-alpha-D-manno-heptose-7-phosphate kinase